MSVWVDLKFLKQISYSLDRWVEKKTTPHMSICRCPLCGDSAKKTNKKRGYFYEKGDKILFHCFNCEAQMPFGKFLKDFDSFIYKQYILEVFKDDARPEVETSKFIVKVSDTLKAVAIKTASDRFFLDTVPITQLDKDHPAKAYFDARLIPHEFNSLFHFTPTFFAWSLSNTDKFKSVLDAGVKDQPRIIIPWYNKDGEILAYQGRSIGNDQPKYYTIVLNPDQQKLFGMDRVDLTRKIYCCEGNMDSLFLDNCVAVGSSALTTFDDTDLDVVYIYDNEKRNPDIVKLISKTVRSGKQVFIPPKSWISKDLNEAIQSGVTVDELKEIIDNNTFSGAAALLKFNQWKRS